MNGMEMNFKFDVTSQDCNQPSPPPAASVDIVELLRQILEVEKEQLAYLRATQDMNARWRAFLARWQEDFPRLSETCRLALPVLERTYAGLIAELTDQICQSDTNSLDNDFALREFLDLHGMRLAQLGTILNQVAPLAEAEST
jgi:hypothetical protein